MKSKFPALAALAAHIEMFGLSKRELDAKFTKSELYILAWRSQEISVGLKATMGKDSTENKSGKKRQEDPSIPEGLPDKFYDEEGNVNLSRVTGEEAWRYLSMQKLRLPVFSR